MLAGDVNPSGKTTLGFARGAGAQPRIYDHKPLARGVPRAARVRAGLRVRPRALVHALRVRRARRSRPNAIATDGSVEIAFTLRNAGARDGDEVVQLYLHDPVASVTRPVQQLRGFARVALAAGAAARVAFRVSRRPLLVHAAPTSRASSSRAASKSRSARRAPTCACAARFELDGALRRVGESRVLASSVTIAEIDLARRS